MATTVWRLLGYSSKDTTPETQATRSLPASWYRSPAIFSLERRAIFSQKWILVTHTLRFASSGEYISFNYAGFSFFLVRDQQGNINGFHNVCRHRAYPIVSKPCGKASVLSCKYHGWSYGLKGNLAKAPRFDTVPSFDKSKHSLLPVHVHIDNLGFIWVNLDASPTPAIPWSSEFEGVDTSPRMSQFQFSSGYSYDHTWDMEINGNWKGVMENYNECYHCPTSHPLIAGVSDLPKYRVDPTVYGNGKKSSAGAATGVLEHTIVNKSKPEEKDEFRRSITFFFPGTSVTVTSNFFYIQRMIPVSATKTRVENEVYRHTNSTDENFADINAFYKQVLEEDKELCDGAQRNLDAGVFVNGELHPDKEKGPIHFQNTVRELLMKHREKELAQGGKEIWPATHRKSGGMDTEKLSEEEQFCSELEAAACTAENSELAW